MDARGCMWTTRNTLRPRFPLTLPSSLITFSKPNSNPGENMNRKDNKLAIAVAAALAFGTTGFSAFAQQTGSNTPQAKERIEVTGSNIKRVEGESALPV